MNISYIRLLTLYVVAIFVTISCAGNPSTAGDYPPLLPPVDSMQMHVSNLPFDSAMADTTVGGEHFSRASNLILSINDDISHLKLPERILSAAHDTDSKLNENNQWEWSFNQYVDGNEYPMRLVASRKNNSKVNWEFYIINSQLGVEDRLFISGESNTEGTNGVWTFYMRNGEPFEEGAQMKWSISAEGEVQKVLEIKTDQSGSEGNTVEYAHDGKRETVIYYDASDDLSVEVQQNINSNIGYIFSPDYNQGEQACWDKSFSDISCSDV